MLISALSLQLADLQSPNLDHGCIWQGCNKCLGLDLLFGVKRVTIDTKHFWKTRVAQIVTGVHRDL